jgi:hypothetical protein
VTRFKELIGRLVALCELRVSQSRALLNSYSHPRNYFPKVEEDLSQRLSATLHTCPTTDFPIGLEHFAWELKAYMAGLFGVCTVAMLFALL